MWCDVVLKNHLLFRVCHIVSRKMFASCNEYWLLIVKWLTWCILPSSSSTVNLLYSLTIHSAASWNFSSVTLSHQLTLFPSESNCFPKSSKPCVNSWPLMKPSDPKLRYLRRNGRMTSCGITGCKLIKKFWKDFSREASIEKSFSCDKKFEFFGGERN